MAAVLRETTTIGLPNDLMREATTTIHAKEGIESFRPNNCVFLGGSAASSALHQPKFLSFYSVGRVRLRLFATLLRSTYNRQGVSYMCCKLSTAAQHQLFSIPFPAYFTPTKTKGARSQKFSHSIFPSLPIWCTPTRNRGIGLRGTSLLQKGMWIFAKRRGCTMRQLYMLILEGYQRKKLRGSLSSTFCISTPVFRGR